MMEAIRRQAERFAAAIVFPDNALSGQAAMTDICITIDHDFIRTWAERRGARPSTDEGDERPWPLQFDIGPPGAGLREIGWAEFFVEFERADLAFVCREDGDIGARDDFHEFVVRATVPALVVSGKLTIVERLS